MIDIYIHMHQISYEDCGVLGGRTAFAAGTEIHNNNEKKPMDFIEDVLGVLVRKSKNGQFFYPFTRMAVCFIDMEGNVSIAYTGDKDIENNTYSYIDNEGNTGKVFKYYEIGRILEQRGIQIYAIFQQLDDISYRVIGNKVHNEKLLEEHLESEDIKVHKKFDGITAFLNKDGLHSQTGNCLGVKTDDILEHRYSELTTDISGGKIRNYDKRRICDYVYDIVRCLDIRGGCKARVVEASAFHNYVKYVMGEGYYIEAIDNTITDSREFWVGRDYTTDKMLLDCFALDDPASWTFIGTDWNVNVDSRFAEIICKFSGRNEYMFIDNDYELRVLNLNRPI